MMKTAKYKYILPACVRWFLLAAVCFLPTALQAQGYYTITNGRYYWFPGGEQDDTTSRYPTGFVGNIPIYRLGTHIAESTTEIVDQGNSYLALDTSDENDPKIVVLPTSTDFDPLCVWYRTGNKGHYYQEWGGYRYYIYATHNEDVSIYKVPVGDKLAKQTTWYDWDHGMAIEEEVRVPGGTRTSYFWLMFDTLDDATGGHDDPEWRMSTVNSYQRPEEIVYRNYRADGNGGNIWDYKSYYDSVVVGNGLLRYPAGSAATYMNVKKVDHPKTIDEGQFLESLSVNEEGTPDLEGYVFDYDAHDITVLPVMRTGPIEMMTIPFYTEYVEETSRRGINVRSDARTTDGFGYAGIPEVRRWYYYHAWTGGAYNGELTRHTVMPEAKSETTTDSLWEYTLDRRATRFMEVREGTGNACILHFKDRPLDNTDIYLTCRVTYRNGVSESITDTIHITVTKSRGTARSVNGPVVKGSVFGGGRMANVNGNTSMIVHNADSIYAVYGGNDIAGWVKGKQGATVQIGTRFTDANHPIHMGWVYGGGCGYYQYEECYNAAKFEADKPQIAGLPEHPTTQDTANWEADNADAIAAASAGAWDPAHDKQKGLTYGRYVFRGGVYDWNTGDTVVPPGVFNYDPYTGYRDYNLYENGDNTVAGFQAGTIPYVKTAHVMVGIPEVEGHNDDFGDNAHEHNDYILIDSLFGGAENAFLGVTTFTDNYASAVTVDINGGSILAVFGGNNYGGGIANTAMTLVNVHCTKLTDDMSLTGNSYYGGFGRDFGIRHLFGGGNIVNSPHSQVTFYGGMVDTAFLGGNMATVASPVGIVNCQRDNNVYSAGGAKLGTAASGTTGFQNGHFIFTNPTLEDTTHAGLRNVALNTGYIPDNGLYNVHFLYGGNNKADMENVGFIQLLSGGVGAVLGGGNEGNMVNNKTIVQAMADHHGYIDISDLVSTMVGILNRSILVDPPAKFGSVVAASQRSQIIADYVHGGCRKANIKNSCGVYLAGGSYYDVFAGNDISGDVGSENDGSTYAVITGDAVIHANVYGGNDGFYHCNDGSGHFAEDKLLMDDFNSDFDYDPYGEIVGLLLPTQRHTNVFVNGGLIKGNLVAGGVLANVGFSGERSSRPRIYDDSISTETGLNTGLKRERLMNDSANLVMNGTVRMEIADSAVIHGNVFGGGSFASIYGLSQMLVRGNATIHGSLFAGNDCLGSVESHLPYQGNLDDDSNAFSYYRYYYDSVYTTGLGSGTRNDSIQYMAAHMSGVDSLKAQSWNRANQFSSNGDSLNYYTNTPATGPYAGIKQYNPRYSTYLLIEDTPVINSVYGSGNGAWNYDGDPSSPWPVPHVCPGQEGNVPDQESAYIDINTSGGFIDTVFGGGAGCTVEKSVVVLLNNKTVNNPAYPETLPAGFVGGTTNSAYVDSNFVGTIFGGNNFSEMNTVPDIRLVKGNVKNIYGGGNTGEMTGLTDVYDICSKVVKDVSTHVLVSSEDVTVTDTIFGGSRMGDVKGMAYVDVRKTSTGGIQYLYGGNDISGNINGNTRIDMAGGSVNRMWGGSNGRYDYLPVDYGMYDVYSFGSVVNGEPTTDRIATAAKPDVDSTSVNLWGGTVNASVFTGGSMASTRATCLIVDDEVGCTDGIVSTGHIIVNGSIYGGGEGRWDDLNARDFDGKRWGNVNGSTYVHLHHAEDVTSATAYGGGGGGDVYNTFIKTYDTWDNRFAAIFGGCWGADVYGTAHLEFNGKELVRNLYGGNDFTGNVYRSEIVVNSGNFHNVFGGGNGSYPDSYYTSQHAMVLSSEFAYQHASPTAYAGPKSLEHPNTEYVHITFNDGLVDSCLYGGGRMGTVLPYKKDANGDYIYEYKDTALVSPTLTADDTIWRFIPDTMRVAYESQYDEDHTQLTFADPTNFSYVVVNIHGGKFQRNVFGGGRGYKDNKKPLVYGLKVVNMDGGEVYESLYGGSEFVNDGYPAECRVPVGIANPTRTQQLAATSMRPSSIVNITGGTIGANFYGTGYQGMVYGSSYVNVGLDAIDSSTVWRNSYGTDSDDSTYIKFKPGYRDGFSDTLKAEELVFKNSLYSGANWGLASGATTFDSPGFVGGESRLYIDGKGYNTTNDPVTSNPEMNIIRSIYGSGTSVLGGDIHSHVEIRNYGGMDPCHPTKTIETIQRTDSLWMHNSAIRLSGTTDASQQYLTNRYAMTHIGHVNYRGYNVTEFEAAVAQVSTLAFYEQGTEGTPHTGEKFDTVLVPLSDINADITAENSVCGDNKDLCLKEYMVSPTDSDLRHTLLILNKGIDFTVGTTMADGDGAVSGYGFMVTPGGYQSTVTARPKMDLEGNFNKDDGGFVTSCQDSNKTRTYVDWETINPDWDGTAGVQATDELPYTNHASTTDAGFTADTKFRVWKVGDKFGLRETEATLLAHTRPERLTQDWSLNLTTGTEGHTAEHQMAIAEAVFTLPATSEGHYYMLTGDGFELTGSNGEIVFVDSAWHPTNLTTGVNGTVIDEGHNVDMSAAMSTIGDVYSPATADANGAWVTPQDVYADMEGTDYIRRSPANTFGLVMVPNNNFMVSEGPHFSMPAAFDNDGDPETDPVAFGEAVSNLVISGNARVNNATTYCSPKVYNNSQSPEIKPSMRLYLTYDTTFSESFVGTVTFKLMEFDADGDTVAPIKVTVYIQTIIEELKDVEQDVLAMYNGGRTNTFTRKIELPPVGEERNLYLTGIKWLPTTGDGSDASSDVLLSEFGSSDLFSLLGDSSLVWATDANYPRESAHPGSESHSSHNRFALTIIPSNNVSGDMNTANGWIRGNGIRTNIYKLASDAWKSQHDGEPAPFSNNGATPVKTSIWNSDHVDTITLRSAANENKGVFLGTLDGRGTAVIDVELTFDGARVYDKVPLRGYVGKAILSVESISDEDDISQGTFHITVYVKTRDHGDTIYLASADSVTRRIAGNKTIKVYPYDDDVHNPHYDESGNPDFTNDMIGKYPSLYVQSFRKALEEGIYQEGDVLAIIDTLKVNSSVHITGPNGPAIEVIRYDGHHHELPDEQSVYRGPMIVVENGNVFSAQNIAFHGGAGAKIKKVVRVTPGDDNSDANLLNGNLQFVNSHSMTVGGVNYSFSSDKKPDTNMVRGPIILLSGEGSSVTLRDGTIVYHNWNGYGHSTGDTNANGWPLNTKYMGAINVSDNATLTLVGNVTVENNFGHTLKTYDNTAIVNHDSVAVQKAPGNGAVYVDDGIVELADANRNTAVTITDNYLMNPAVHSGSGTVLWWSVKDVNGIPERFVLSEDALATWHRANVYLTRTPLASESYYTRTMNDTQSDLIVISGTIGDSTKIGVRKWFPGMHERDTVQIVTVKGGNNTLLASAMENKSFSSDDHFRVFYNPLVNLTTGYLFRCATFRHQKASDLYVGPVHERHEELALRSGDVLKFGVRENVCPTGGDSIIYRVQGGLMPYTYTWSDPAKELTLSRTVTPYSNAQVVYDLDNDELAPAERYAKYAASMADTLLLPYEPINPSDKRKWNHLRVTATDATRECTLYKDIDLRILMDHDATDDLTYWPKASAVGDTLAHRFDNDSPWRTDTVGTGWTDTARTVKAIASRNFKGVQIVPKVWVNRSSGTISATVTTNDNYADDYVYQYLGEGEGHELESLNLCPGDTIYLLTQPLGAGTHFVMWDFDPYYSPLAIYAVPGMDAAVTAYYGPKDYWKDVVNTPELGGVYYDDQYDYTGVADKGFVVTHSGDVHIYNENGLAWFISAVNGYNSTQARTYRYNRVYLHQKAGGYDMKEHLWTPVGSLQHPFRGWLRGTGSGLADTAQLAAGQKVVVKNIILNEPERDYVGLFGIMDTARVSGIKLSGAMVRGSQYVGTLAGKSTESKVWNVTVADSAESVSLPITTVVVSHYASGGLLGWAKNDTIQGPVYGGVGNPDTVFAKFIGDAVYNGGVVGYNESTEINNHVVYTENRVSGLYLGGIVGNSTAALGPQRGPFGLFGRKTGNPSHIANNYVRIHSGNMTQRVGGIAGYAENTIIENNYVYGQVEGTVVDGAVAAMTSNGAQADHNYYAKGSAKHTVGFNNGGSIGNTSSFQGGGNDVVLDHEVDGTNNLTRVLNIWVRDRNVEAGYMRYSPWRSDLERVNSGYPVFGLPDMIPVRDSLTVEECEQYELDGVVYTSDTVVSINVIDSILMVDSTLYFNIIIHHGSQTDYADSATVAEGYEGYGFSVTPTEAEMLRSAIDSLGFATIVLTDTLASEYGCDSIITLTLTFTAGQGVVNVSSMANIRLYPNPTLSIVNVEAMAMSRLELYDNEGRKLADYTAEGDRISIDLTGYASGIYYIRIHTPSGVTIQKVIKK